VTVDAGGDPSDAFTLRQLDDALAVMGDRLGLDVGDAQLVKFTHNATYLLPREQVVARLVGSRAMLHRAAKVVDVARWLADQGFPAVRLVSGIAQPVHVDGFVATFWDAVERDGPSPTAGDLGRLLRHFHRLPPPVSPLPGWDPIDDVRRRLHHADGLTADDLAFLHAQADELDAELGDLSPTLVPGPIHGDAFVGNLIAGPHGPVLCDFDSTSHGPREWDLTPVTLTHLRFGQPATDHLDLARAYGFDVTGWEGFAVLRRVRELKLVTSVVPVLRTNPRVAAQFAARLASLRSPDASQVWERY